MISVVLGKILEEYSDRNNRIGLVEFEGKRRPVYLTLVPEAHVGDYVRFHAGFATERVSVSESTGAGEQFDGSAEAPDRQPDLDSLHAYRLLSELDPQQLRKLLPMMQEKHFNAGQIVFHSGDKSSFLHLIVLGEVALEEETGDRPVHVQTLHAGEATGWSALMAEARTHFRARALSPVCTVALPGDQIRKACDRDPAMGYALMKRLLEMVTERLDAMRIMLARRDKPEELQ